MELRWHAIEQAIAQHLLPQPGGEALCAYIHDLPALHRHVADVVASLPARCDMFYAIKANSELPILQTLAPLVAGFEVSSGGELAWVRQHFPALPVIFSGPGKLDGELAAATAAGVAALHVESLFELERLRAVLEPGGAQQAVYLRINLAMPHLAATSLMMGGKPSPFGIASDQLPAVLAWLQQQNTIVLRGFHFHLLSHQHDCDAHLALLAHYLEQVNAWCEQYRLDARRVNVGGGIGINYRQPERQFDWPRFAAGLHALLARWPQIELLRFECGRYLTAACGYYAMQVLELKQAFGQHYAVGRGGTHHFRTPQAQGHSHPFRVLPVENWPHPYPRPALQNQTVTVVGQLCTPKDVLASEPVAGWLQVGDVLVFPYAGAYAWHISHTQFLRHVAPKWLWLPHPEPAVPAYQSQ